MDIIHDPRSYTLQQKHLMEALVGYVFGISRLDIKVASNELTANIAVLGELVPKDTYCIPEESREALY